MSALQRAEPENCVPFTVMSDSAAIWSWDLTKIGERVAKRLGWTSDFTALVELEYRRFMALAALEPAAKLGMRGAVDEIWHEHIVSTRDYERFCRAVAGRFIHHEPQDHGEVRSADSYVRTLELLRRHFGDVTEAVWPTVGQSSTSCDSCACCDKIELAAPN